MRTIKLEKKFEKGNYKKIATKTTLPFHNKQIQSRNNREKSFQDSAETSPWT